MKESKKSITKCGENDLVINPQKVEKLEADPYLLEKALKVQEASFQRKLDLEIKRRREALNHKKNIIRHFANRSAKTKGREENEKANRGSLCRECCRISNVQAADRHYHEPRRPRLAILGGNMWSAIVFIAICLVIMGWITYRIIEEDKRINNTRKECKKNKRGKK